MPYHRLSEALQDYLLSPHRDPNDTKVQQALGFIRKSPLGYFFNLPTVVPIEPTSARILLNHS